MSRTRSLMTAAAIAAAAATATPANAMGADNTAVNVNTHDGQSRYRVAFKIQRVNKDVVDNANAAVAVGSCDRCQTVSVAMQTLLLFRDPRTFTPENVAFAMNLGCSQCNTVATAYLDVLQTGGPAHFTASGNQRIAGIRHELHSLRKSDPSIYEVQQQVDGLHTELRDVLATDVVSAGAAREQAKPRSTEANSEPAPAQPTAAEPPEPTADNGTTSPGPATAAPSGEGTTQTEDSSESVAPKPSTQSAPTDASDEAATALP